MSVIVYRPFDRGADHQIREPKLGLRFEWNRSFERFQSTLDLTNCMKPRMNQE